MIDTQTMRRIDSDGVPRYVFPAIECADVGHGIFTRVGGCSQGAVRSLNVGHTVGDDATSVRKNHEVIYRTLDCRQEQVVAAHQVHGTAVCRVGCQQGGQIVRDADALITDAPGIYLLLRFADCVPLLFYARDKQAVGLAHAGRKGTLEGIAAITVEAMEKAFGADPARMWAGVGPAIGPCCYQVGPEIVEQVSSSFSYSDELLSRYDSGGRAYLDLWKSNQKQLCDSGVRNIDVGGICTACHTETFYSHRAEKGATGRFAAVIGLRDR